MWEDPMRTPPDYETDIEIAEVAQQAQRLFALADQLVARAERIRDSAERLVSSAPKSYFQLG